MMGMKTRALAAAVMGAALLTGCQDGPQVESAEQTAEAKKGLYFYNWNDFIAENTLDDFTKATGINVTYDVYDSNEVLEGKLLSGRTGFDLVSPSHDFYATQIKAGVYAKLDKSSLPNLKNLDENIMEQMSKNLDEGNQYGIPYLWGTTGFAYNVDKVKAVLGEDAPVDSWSLLFEPENMEKLKSCGVAFLDAPSEVLPAVMAYLGLEGDSLEKADYEKAVAKMKEVAPYIQYFHSSRSISDLANGDICVALGWSGDMMIARDRAKQAGQGVDIQYVVPKEGAPMWMDMLAIPADAPNKEAAHQMLNYLMEPEVIAEVTNYVTYSNPNPSSKPFVTPEIANDPGVFPSEETMANLFMFKELPKDLKRYITREWSRIKTGA